MSAPYRCHGYVAAGAGDKLVVHLVIETEDGETGDGAEFDVSLGQAGFGVGVELALDIAEAALQLLRLSKGLYPSRRAHLKILDQPEGTENGN